MRDLRDQHAALCAEAFALLKAGDFVPFPDDINEGGWWVHGLRRLCSDVANRAPVASAMLAPHREIIQNAAYSLLEPRAEISPHRGYTSAVLRLHHALLVPQVPGCELVVAGKVYRWRAGETVCFDDTQRHSAYNRTGEIRIVLIVDLFKERL